MKGLLFCAGVGLLTCAASGQSMYIYSNIAVNESNGNVTVDASTSTDYNSAYYYDIGVQTQLVVDPQGGSSYTACNNFISSNNYSTSLPPCTINVGPQSANLSLSSFHYLNVTYYYYQVLPCSWECNYYSDYYGFSLISSAPSYTDNQYFYAPGSATPLAQQSAKSGWINRIGRRGACFYPTSETTGSGGWNAYHSYLGQFLMSLGGGSFNDRFVDEAFSGTAVDQCWRSQNGGQPVGNPTPSGWLVKYIKGVNASGTGADFLFTYTNAWGYDHLGFYGTSGSTTLYNYVNNMRPSNGSCQVAFNQNMYMYCSAKPGPGQYYVTGNPLTYVISATPSAASLSSTRAGTMLLRSYP